MRTLIAGSVLTVLALVPVGAGAEEPLGYGAKRCSHYTAARSGATTAAKVDMLAMTGWVGGYLQALAACRASQGAPALSADGGIMRRAFAWLDGYCREHPDEPWATAVTMAGDYLAGVEVKR